MGPSQDPPNWYDADFRVIRIFHSLRHVSTSAQIDLIITGGARSATEPQESCSRHLNRNSLSVELNYSAKSR